MASNPNASTDRHLCERAVIGAVLLDPDCIAELDLDPSDFTGGNRIVWKSILSLDVAGSPIDMLTVAVQAGDDAAKFNGVSFLANLVAETPTAANVGYYAGLVKSEAKRRRLLAVADSIRKNADSDPDELHQQVERAVMELAGSQRLGPVRIGAGIREAIKAIETAYESGNPLTGLTTGFPSLDRNTCGLQDSDLIIVAARPSIGKTALGLNIAEHISINKNTPGLFFSREMSKEALRHRLLCSRAMVCSIAARRGVLKPADFARLTQAAMEIHDAPLFIDDGPNDVYRMRSVARRMKRREGIKYVVADYLQLIEAPGAESRTAEVEAVSKQLKEMAKELGLPVIALAQINRESEKGANTRPRLDQLKGSGAIEQDADVVIILHRKKEEDVEPAELFLAKQRNGPIGLIDVRYDGPHTRFVEVERV